MASGWDSEWQKSRGREEENNSTKWWTLVQNLSICQEVWSPPQSIFTYADAFYRLLDLYIFVPSRYSDQLFFSVYYSHNLVQITALFTLETIKWSRLCNFMVRWYTEHIFPFFPLFLHLFFRSCSADCPSLRLFIQSTRNQCSVKPLRTTMPLHASVIVVEEEKEGKWVNREWCEVVEVRDNSLYMCHTRPDFGALKRGRSN